MVRRMPGELREDANGESRPAGVEQLVSGVFVFYGPESAASERQPQSELYEPAVVRPS